MISVIIPTYDRATSLLRCLDHLAMQSAVELISEIIIVDDASPTPDGAELSAAHTLAHRIRYVRLSENLGPGGARNVGVDLAGQSTTLFVDDDILLAPDALEKMALAGLPRTPEDSSLFGRVAWDSSIRVTPFMHWMTNGGPLFPYHRITDPNDCHWTYFVTSLIASSTELIRTERFTERLRCRYEDLELGYRLQRRRNNLLRFVPDAVAGDLHGRGLVEWLSDLGRIEADLVLLSEMTNQEMANAFSIERAKSLTHFAGRPLNIACDLIRAFEPVVTVPPQYDRYYGDVWEWQSLEQSYRIIQNYFRIVSIRAALKEIPLVAIDMEADSTAFAADIIEKLSKFTN